MGQINMRARNTLIILGASLLAMTSAIAAEAQTAPPTRIRGTIEATDAHSMTVKTRSGDKVQIALIDPLNVLTVKKVALASIGKGNFVGIATRTGADGTQQAIEVLVFPEMMRGAGEGSYPWDLEPGSTMTNGTVNGAVKAASATDLTVAYKEGSKNIHVAPGAPIVTFAPAERADVKAGAPVFVAATKAADGTFSTARVVVGKDGVAPPM
jgi:hypothetical protein